MNQNRPMGVAHRRSGVSPGTPHADSLQHFLVINVLEPGGNAFAIPVFPDHHAATAEPYFFGDLDNDEIGSWSIYDPFHICCAIGPEEINKEMGWVEGDIVLGRFNQYNKRYEVAYPYGLVRKAQLSGDLEAEGDADAQILAHTRSGGDLGGIPITIYHWGNSGSDTIPSGTPVQAFYESSARRWYTAAVFFEDPPPP